MPNHARASQAEPARELAAESGVAPLPVESNLQRVIESTETVLTALLLALVFRAFFVEAFIIPTGSMAETLLGAHATRVCPTCGWQYDFGPVSPAESGDAPFLVPSEILCPNCHARVEPQVNSVIPRSGDRILVHKWPIGLDFLFPPRRWDVIVFRDPKDPAMNYIKRLVGLPGESVEIIDGDVYVDGLIARKTAAAQHALWALVYDQDHAPRDTPELPQRPRWSVEAGTESQAAWSGLDGRVFRFDAPAGATSTIVFNRPRAALYIQDVTGYNHGSSQAYAGDVRLRVEYTRIAGADPLRLELKRGGFRFTLALHPERCALMMAGPGDAEPRCVAERQVQLSNDTPYGVEFAHVDYRVHALIDGREVLTTTDADYRPDVAGLRVRPVPHTAELRIGGAGGAFELRRLRIDRDVYYTYRPGLTRRATPGQPFKLFDQEYFVLGDNSAHSHDGREWNERGPHLPDDYRTGTVRADQIVGRAAFVYFPGLLPFDGSGKWRVPDVGSMRFVR